MFPDLREWLKEVRAQACHINSQKCTVFTLGHNVSLHHESREPFWLSRSFIIFHLACSDDFPI